MVEAMEVRRVLVLVTVAVTVAVLGTPAGARLSVRWRNMGRAPDFRPYDVASHQRRLAAEARQLHLSLALTTTAVTLHVGQSQVYGVSGTAVTQTQVAGMQSGVHVLVLHETHGRLLMARRFLTHQPAEQGRLAACLGQIQPGRVLILAALPEWVMFLGREAEDALAALGSTWVRKVTAGEAWAWVGVVGGGTVVEGVTTREPHHYPAGGMLLEAYVPRAPPRRPCGWEARPQLHRQAAFCDQYEGYGDLCDCRRPFLPDPRPLPDSRHHQAGVAGREVIPVVVVTADKPHHLYRLLRQLLTLPGANKTEVLVVVDGWQEEAVALAGLLGVQLALHNPEGHGNNRTNSNIRFALYTAFQRFPQADKVIVLEDDLILSPDLLSYFREAAPVLDVDPTVYCVNAFSSYSYPDTAHDLGALVRVRSYPMYGWMVTRAYAHEVIRKWVPPGLGDWDWWLAWEDLRRGRDVVVPEVSRTLHAGSAGLHVNGFEQQIYFSRMTYNHDPHARLMDPALLVRARYDARLAHDLEGATQLAPPHADLCNTTWLQPRASPAVVYLFALDDNDHYYSFKIFLICLRTYDRSTREIYKGVVRLRWRGVLLYLVGCPYSPFCEYRSRELPLYRPSEGEVEAALATRDAWDQQFLVSNPRVAHLGLPDLSLSSLLTRPPPP